MCVPKRDEKTRATTHTNFTGLNQTIKRRKQQLAKGDNKLPSPAAVGGANCRLRDTRTLFVIVASFVSLCFEVES